MLLNTNSGSWKELQKKGDLRALFTLPSRSPPSTVSKRLVLPSDKISVALGSTDACHRVGDCPWAQLQPPLLLRCHFSAAASRRGTSATGFGSGEPRLPCFALGLWLLYLHKALLTVFFLSHSLPSFVCSSGESSWLSAALSEPHSHGTGPLCCPPFPRAPLSGI